MMVTYGGGIMHNLMIKSLLGLCPYFVSSPVFPGLGKTGSLEGARVREMALVRWNKALAWSLPLARSPLSSRKLWEFIHFMIFVLLLCLLESRENLAQILTLRTQWVPAISEKLLFVCFAHLCFHLLRFQIRSWL